MSDNPQEAFQAGGNLSFDATALMPPSPQPIRKQTLLEIFTRLSTLSAHMGSVPPELEKEFAEAAREALLSYSDKVDSYGKLITYYMRRAASAEAELAVIKKEEIERLTKRAKRERADAERLGTMALYVIRTQEPNEKLPGGYPALQGVNCTLKPVRVPDSIDTEGYDESVIPREFKKAIVSNEWPLAEWVELTLNSESSEKIIDVVWNVSYSVDKKALLAALKKECESCSGVGHKVTPGQFEDSFDEIPCEKCNGKGTQLIPGARLMTGKLRLEIE